MIRLDTSDQSSIYIDVDHALPKYFALTLKININTNRNCYLILHTDFLDNEHFELIYYLYLKREGDLEVLFFCFLRKVVRRNIRGFKIDLN